MSKKVVFTITAKLGLRLITNYLLEKWSFKVKKDFISKFEKSIKQIQKFPHSCEKSELIEIRKCVFTKQTSFYYKITNDEIIIIAMIDNRMLKNIGIIL